MTAIDPAQLYSRCTARQAVAVVFRHGHGLTLERVAELMRITARAVRYLLANAAARLRGIGVTLPAMRRGRRRSAAVPISQIASNRYGNPPDVDKL